MIRNFYQRWCSLWVEKQGIGDEAVKAIASLVSPLVLPDRTLILKV
ncbi:hypothetical protein [Halotia branconii]|uniref:Uncharacterized protein n=1 Tax=Halotia branconii CENA392 TaxID=1539056 RepID=A0AAJ6NMR4_9CYAN|nr:hypothetical protein [Halotia branconii]WGV23383.1 hypothetical protein QI031_16275 [Halotia branconii CENA392]